MTLREWLDMQPPGGVQREVGRLATAAKVNARSVHRYAAQERTPPLEVAIAISRATGSRVKVADLVKSAGLVTGISMTGGADVEECAS